MQQTTQPMTQDSTVFSKLGFWSANAFLFAYNFVLAGGFFFQFALHEFPCPLCMIQRYFMMLASFGPLYIILSTRNGSISITKFMRGYGLSLLAAFIGSTASIRQILLHIKPGDPGYGSAVFGIHTYTWALVSFVVVMIFCAFMMIFAKQLCPKGSEYNAVTTVNIWIFAILVVANLIAIIAEEGFHWLLPDNPTVYRLFQ
ncbi:disulfide bond formation protein B [Agrilactobacillus fermenti]|uniref:disulfide bond formation protein B n=1 Tax=Agrilactobacillus fermenti TaxID=2586909 RepID=UPI001E349CD4|nr:disulfide bond formation protein B [Agrilactobacillus fermenti]